MKESEIKDIATRAEKSAVKLDVCLSAFSGEIEAMKKASEENDGENIYSAMFLDGIHTLIGEEVEKLLQIKHDLLKKIETQARA